MYKVARLKLQKEWRLTISTISTISLTTHWNKVEPKPSVCHSVDRSKLATTTLSIARKSPSGCEAFCICIFSVFRRPNGRLGTTTRKTTLRSLCVGGIANSGGPELTLLASNPAIQALFAHTDSYMYTYTAYTYIIFWYILYVHVKYTEHIHMSTRQALVTLYATIGNVPTELPKKTPGLRPRIQQVEWQYPCWIHCLAIQRRWNCLPWILELDGIGQWWSVICLNETLRNDLIKYRPEWSHEWSLWEHWTCDSVSHVSFSEIMSGLWSP